MVPTTQRPNDLEYGGNELARERAIPGTASFGSQEHRLHDQGRSHSISGHHPEMLGLGFRVAPGGEGICISSQKLGAVADAEPPKPLPRSLSGSFTQINWEHSDRKSASAVNFRLMRCLWINKFAISHLPARKNRKTALDQVFSAIKKSHSA